MSIQELFHLNAFNGTTTGVGNLDIFARVMSASSIAIDKPYLNLPKTSIYQWNNVVDIAPSPSQTVNGLFTCNGAGQGTLFVPNQIYLDEYFGTTSKGYMFSVEVLNATGNPLKISNNGVDIITIQDGSLLAPSYNKYYFTKLEDNGEYLCVNNSNVPFS